MALDSRAKGKAGELDACHTLSQLFGFQCRRSQQFSGWSGGNSPDIEVTQTPDLFWEIKRVEKLNVGRALSLAIKQCGRKCPVVMHRPNRSPNGWMLTLRLTDLPRLVHAYQRALDSDTATSGAVAAPQLSDANADNGTGLSKTAGVARAVPPFARQSAHHDHARHRSGDARRTP